MGRADKFLSTLFDCDMDTDKPGSNLYFRQHRTNVRKKKSFPFLSQILILIGYIFQNNNQVNTYELELLIAILWPLACFGRCICIDRNSCDFKLGHFFSELENAGINEKVKLCRGGARKSTAVTN
jgi:hypothetical protein